MPKYEEEPLVLQCRNMLHAEEGVHHHGTEVPYLYHQIEVPDMVNHPPHYDNHPSGVECITITECYNFNIGNAIKYLWRHNEKGSPIIDLEKAQWYIAREIERLQKADFNASPTFVSGS